MTEEKKPEKLHIEIIDSNERGLEIKCPMFQVHLDSLDMQHLKSVVNAIIDLYKLV